MKADLLVLCTLHLLVRTAEKLIDLLNVGMLLDTASCETDKERDMAIGKILSEMAQVVRDAASPSSSSITITVKLARTKKAPRDVV